jgi:acyl-CoA thioesterase YciA
LHDIFKTYVMVESEILQSRIILPAHLNDQNALFGGIAMKWMDEVAYIKACRFTGMNMVTVGVERIRFCRPLHQGDIANIRASIADVGNVKLKLKVEILRSDKFSAAMEPSIEAIFVFTAVNEKHQPQRLLHNPEFSS